MCALAGELSQQAKGLTTPVTDGDLHHVGAFGWSIPQIARALLPDMPPAERRQQAAADDDDNEAALVAVAVRTLAPDNLGAVPVERILELRDAYDSDFARYRARIAELASEVGSLEGVRDAETLAQHVEIRYEQTVGADLNDLRKILRSQRFDVVDTALSFHVVAPSGLLLGGLTALAGPAVGAIAATAVAATGAVRGLAAKRDKAMSQSSAAWLLRIEKDLAPQQLAGRVWSSLRRFLA